jgi:hypothetical protein
VWTLALIVTERKRIGLKNKTTKSGFVVELHMCIPDILHILVIRYFFLVVFFAFFAGAFFVAMSHHPLPLVKIKYVANR